MQISSLFPQHKSKDLGLLLPVFWCLMCCWIPFQWNGGTSHSMITAGFFNFGTLGILEWVPLCCGELSYIVGRLAASLACIYQMAVALLNCDYKKYLKIVAKYPWMEALRNQITPDYSGSWSWMCIQITREKFKKKQKTNPDSPQISWIKILELSNAKVGWNRLPINFVCFL